MFLALIPARFSLQSVWTSKHMRTSKAASRTFTILLLLSILFVPVSYGSAVESPRLTASDLETFLEGVMPLQLEREDIAGAVISVVKNGEVIFAKGYGYADVEKRKPVSPELTLFRPGSVSKLFIWTSVMQLIEQGKLDLDRDVNEYIDFRFQQSFRSQSLSGTS